MDISDLGVAHGTVAGTDDVCVGKEGVIRVFICEGIHAYGIRSVDGVALDAQILWGDLPAIATS